MNEQEKLELERAYQTWLARKERREHPDGSFDKQRRFYPSAAEAQDCCNAVRSPSRAYPYSYMTHCRSAEHVARLHGVSPSALKRLVASEAAAAASRSREGGEDYYKVVALVSGRMLSIMDGETEYRLDETLTQRARQDHQGGYYVYASADAAARAQLPEESALPDAPRVMLRVRAEGQYCRYDNGKLSFSRVTPVEVVPMPARAA